MLNQVSVIIFTFALCYLGSRLLLRTAWFPPGMAGLRLVHVASAVMVILIAFVPKLLAHGNNNNAPLIIAFLQFCCFLIDAQRKRYPRGTLA